MKFYNLKHALQQKEAATELYLNRMQLRVVPREVFLLKHLKKLDVSYNDIEALQDDFGQLSQLEHLVLAHNPLLKTPAPIMQLPQLLTLDLSYCELKEFPKYLDVLKLLRELKITHNRLGAVPDHVGQLKLLNRLDLSNNNIQKISRLIGRLHFLEFLDLSHNQLTSIPKAIGQCESLDTLNISHNRLNRLPESIGGLKKLRKLNLDSNKLKSFPGNIGSCEQLRTLSAQQNRINDTENLGHIKSLAYLYLQKNQIKSIPHTLSQCRMLYELNLSNNKLQQLPEIFWTFGQLTIVDLSKNQLVQLPKFGQSVKQLICNNNQIHDLSNSLKHTRFIKRLELNQNPVEQIPNYFEAFKQLRKLYLRGNLLSGQLPLAFLYLDSLREFKGSIPQLSSNQLIRFVQACQSNKVPDQDRVAYFQALTGDEYAFASSSRSLTFNALNFPMADVQYAARMQLLRRNRPSLMEKPLEKGAHISLIGKTFFNILELKERLETLDIHFSNAITSETTHIILGYRPVQFDPKLNNRLVFINEKALTLFLNQAENRYLAVQQDEKQLQSLEKLLLNPRDTNIGLAVQLLKGGGVPHSLLTALLIAWKFTNDRHIQKELRILLELNISEEARRALKYPVSFSTKQSPQRLASSIALITENTEFDQALLEKFFGNFK